jgi:hypothetical protein
MGFGRRTPAEAAGIQGRQQMAHNHSERFQETRNRRAFMQTNNWRSLKVIDQLVIPFVFIMAVSLFFVIANMGIYGLALYFIEFLIFLFLAVALGSIIWFQRRNHSDENPTKRNTPSEEGSSDGEVTEPELESFL